MRANANSGFRSGRGFSAAGFTMIELSAVIFIIFVLVSLFSAALNNTKHKALVVTCVDNFRQLQTAWYMYSSEDEGRLPLNQSAPVPPLHGIISRRTSTNSWVVGNPLEDLDTRGIERGTLFPYTKAAAVYRCPLDRSRVVNHPEILRTRSYSMSAYLGGDDPEGRESRVKFRIDELARPENVFVFIEEDENSIWLPNFTLWPREKTRAMPNADWISTPSDRHERGCNLSFADGHIERWRWYSNHKSDSPPSKLTSAHENPDLRRLQGCLPQP